MEDKKDSDTIAMNIKIPVLATDDGVFEVFTVNAIDFAVKSPQEAMRIIFRDLAPLLRNELSIYAYPHGGKLYFIFDKIVTGFKDMLKSRIDALFRDCNSCIEYNHQNVQIVKLKPLEQVSHLVVLKQLVYEYLKGVVVKYTRFAGFDRGSRSEGLVALCGTLSKFEVKSEKVISMDVAINRYLRLYFEVTPLGRGRIWFDIQTRAYAEPVLGLPRYLSHHEMKEYNNRLYNVYREKAILDPMSKYSEMMKCVDKLKLKEQLLSMCFYVYNPSNGLFEQRCIIFRPLT